MGLGISIFVTAIGAILAFGVDATVKASISSQSAWRSWPSVPSGFSCR